MGNITSYFLPKTEEVLSFDNPEDAITNNNFHDLKLLRDYGCLMDTSHLILATKLGHIEIMKWLLTQFSVKLNEKIFSTAVKSGNPETVDFLIDIGCPYNKNIFNNACYYGNLDIVSLVFNKLNTRTFICEAVAYENAIEGSNIEIVKFLFDNNIPYNFFITTVAVRYNNLDILKLLVEKGIDLTTITFNIAAEHGDTTILDFLYDNDCPVEDYIMTFAIRSKKLENVKWFIDKKISYDKRVFKRIRDKLTSEMVSFLSEEKLI